MKDESHFTEKDRVVLQDTHDKAEHIPVEVADYVTDRLNTFTLELSEHISQSIQGSVKITVNGKIDNLTKIVEAHILASKESVDFIDDLKGANNVIQYIFKLLIALGSATGVLWAFIHYLKN